MGFAFVCAKQEDDDPTGHGPGKCEPKEEAT